MKSVETLVEDIYGLFSGHVCDPDRVEVFGKAVAATVASRLAEYNNTRAPTLRMSNLGRPDRQLWYDLNSEECGEELEPYTKIKFLYGDILEALLLFLAEEAGHEVDRKQVEVEVDGIIGHNDAVIDGVVVDCKSASTYAFKKFKDKSLKDDDPFGYLEQLAGYSEGLGGLDGGFLAIDKTLGHICFMDVPREELQALRIRDRIAHLKGITTSEEIPERCYDLVEEGKSGNLGLPVGCSYCKHKFHCYSDANNGIGLRTFLYSSGPKHLAHVEKEPNVMEITF